MIFLPYDSCASYLSEIFGAPRVDHRGSAFIASDVFCRGQNSAHLANHPEFTCKSGKVAQINVATLLEVTMFI